MSQSKVQPPSCHGCRSSHPATISARPIQDVAYGTSWYSAASVNRASMSRGAALVHAFM
jgi:hypothetical protein